MGVPVRAHLAFRARPSLLHSLSICDARAPPPPRLPARSIFTAASFESPPAWTQNAPGLFRGMLWRDFVEDDNMKIKFWCDAIA